MEKTPEITTIAEFPHRNGKFTVVVQKRGDEIYYNARLADPSDKGTLANLEDDLRAGKQGRLIPLITEAEEQLASAIAKKKKRKGYADHIAVMMGEADRASGQKLEALPDGLWCMMRHPVYTDRNRSGGTVKSYLSMISEATGIDIPVETTAAKIIAQRNIPETLYEVSSPESLYTLVVRQQGAEIVYSVKTKAVDNSAALQGLADCIPKSIFLSNGALCLTKHPVPTTPKRTEIIAANLTKIAALTGIDIPVATAKKKIIAHARHYEPTPQK